jgi:hypothetical protein
VSAIPTNPPKPPEPPVTPREFLEGYPLYRSCQLDHQWDTPGTLSLDCWNCKKETTWAQDDRGRLSSNSLLLRTYVCHLCGRANIQYVIAQLAGNAVMKVGQFPRQSTRVPHSVEKRLGASTDFYRKALTSQSEGYGLGAVVYFRRVAEGQDKRANRRRG